MVDLALVDQLVRALRPEARLVLIGDADQLPAIQAGSVFRDLGALALRLPESHRMSPDDPAGAAILAAARAIAGGAPPAGTPAIGSAGLDALAFSGFELCEPDAARRQRPPAGRRFLRALVRPAPPADCWRHSIRARPCGSTGSSWDAAGEALARGSARSAPARAPPDRHPRRSGGERADQRRARAAARRTSSGFATDGRRARARHAGDDGRERLRPEPDERRPGGGARRRRRSGQPHRPWWPSRSDGALALFPAATLRGAIAVSYATTVHKAQGSELESAALILPEADLPLLSRELVYTAVTRARRSMVVVGRAGAARRGAPAGRWDARRGSPSGSPHAGAFAPPAPRAIDER